MGALFNLPGNQVQSRERSDLQIRQVQVLWKRSVLSVMGTHVCIFPDHRPRVMCLESPGEADVPVTGRGAAEGRGSWKARSLRS